MKSTLKELRARHNMTQEEVAKALGVHPNTYRGWERDPSMIQISKVYSIAELFDVSIDDIFMRSDTMPNKGYREAKEVHHA